MKERLNNNPSGSEGVHVVFSGRADLPFLRLLKPGFRHCFLVIEQPNFWVLYEPLSTRTEISVFPKIEDRDILDWFRQMRFTILPAAICQSTGRSAPWGPYTCVEAVKRFLGIRDRRIVTPWRLYVFLREQNKKMLDSRKN